MKPLEGVVILDLSRVLAAPFGTMIMAELGATVIKVERPGAGDETRVNQPMIKGESGYFFIGNRSKQSITLNLKHPEAQKIVRELAAKSDIVVENYTVGTLARVGLDYESLKKVNPRLVYVSLTGFGQDGPYAKRLGYDTIIQAMSGLTGLTGEKGRGPVKAGLPMGDLNAALWTVIAALTGLAGRNASGHGCYIDVSMLDTMIAMLSVSAARYFALGEVPERMGNEHLGRVPSGAWQCQDGKWVQISTSENQWPALCKALEIEEWGRSPEVATNDARVVHRDQVKQRLAEVVAKWTRPALLDRCEKLGVPIGPVNDLHDVMNDPHVRARGSVKSFNHPVVGEFGALAVPLKFRDLDEPDVGRPPLLGEHTEKVLKERLGMTDAHINQLRAQGAI